MGQLVLLKLLACRHGHNGCFINQSCVCLSPSLEMDKFS